MLNMQYADIRLKQVKVAVSCRTSLVKGNWIKGFIHIQSEMKNERTTHIAPFAGHDYLCVHTFERANREIALETIPEQRI